MFEEERNTKSFVGGLITGGILGGLAGLLFAPKSGKEIRQDISDKSNEILKDTNHLIGDAREKAADIISEAKKKAESLIEEGKLKVKSISDDAENLISHGKEIAEEEISNVKDAVKSGVDAYNNERNKVHKVSGDYNSIYSGDKSKSKKPQY